jgi:hypothetical protein
MAFAMKRRMDAFKKADKNGMESFSNGIAPSSPAKVNGLAKISPAASFPFDNPADEPQWCCFEKGGLFADLWQSQMSLWTLALSCLFTYILRRPSAWSVLMAALITSGVCMASGALLAVVIVAHLLNFKEILMSLFVGQRPGRHGKASERMPVPGSNGTYNSSDNRQSDRFGGRLEQDRMMRGWRRPFYTGDKNNLSVEERRLVYVTTQNTNRA